MWFFHTLIGKWLLRIVIIVVVVVAFVSFFGIIIACSNQDKNVLPVNKLNSNGIYVEFGGYDTYNIYKINKDKIIEYNYPENDSTVYKINQTDFEGSSIVFKIENSPVKKIELFEQKKNKAIGLYLTMDIKIWIMVLR